MAKNKLKIGESGMMLEYPAQILALEITDDDRFAIAQCIGPVSTSLEHGADGRMVVRLDTAEIYDPSNVDVFFLIHIPTPDDYYITDGESFYLARTSPVGSEKGISIDEDTTLLLRLISSDATDATYISYDEACACLEAIKRWITANTSPQSP